MFIMALIKIKFLYYLILLLIGEVFYLGSFSCHFLLASEPLAPLEVAKRWTEELKNLPANYPPELRKPRNFYNASGHLFLIYNDEQAGFLIDFFKNLNIKATSSKPVTINPKYDLKKMQLVVSDWENCNLGFGHSTLTFQSVIDDEPGTPPYTVIWSHISFAMGNNYISSLRSIEAHHIKVNEVVFQLSNYLDVSYQNILDYFNFITHSAYCTKKQAGEENSEGMGPPEYHTIQLEENLTYQREYRLLSNNCGNAVKSSLISFIPSILEGVPRSTLSSLLPERPHNLQKICIAAKNKMEEEEKQAKGRQVGTYLSPLSAEPNRICHAQDPKGFFILDWLKKNFHLKS